MNCLKTLYSGEEGIEKIERLRDFYVLLKDLDDKDKIKAIPIIPMLPAKDVSIVLPFFVKRFFSLLHCSTFLADK